MKYSIKKDETPENTVKRIKKILDKYGVYTEVARLETGEFHSSSVIKFRDFDNDINANGKGANEINCLASGYAEFMERLQTNFLIPFCGEKFNFESDEKIENIKNLCDNSLNIHLKKFNTNIEEIFEISKLARSKSCEGAFDKVDENKTFTAPFVSYKNKKIEYIPLLLQRFLQCSNGFAAGNTFEEASVQGLSEVIERYCAKQIFVKKISMPNIPKEYYEQYENIIGLIKEIENLGYSVTLKDASLGNNFPVICAIFEDKIYPKNGVVFKFGAHPYFPIALERSLTEFLQGNSGFDEYRKKAKYLHNINCVSVPKIIIEQLKKRKFLKKTNQHIKKILTNKPDYEFNKDTWLFNEEIDNKTMFNNLAKLVLKHTDDIYIRNCSFLGFPTVSIYAYEFSDPMVYSNDIFKKMKKMYRYRKTIQDFLIFDVFEACKFAGFERLSGNAYFSEIKDYSLGFYASILLNNKKYIKKFLNVIIGACCVQSSSKNTDTRLHLYQAYLKYFKLYYTNTPKEKIQEIIEKKYSKIIYLEIIKTLESLNEDKIKQMISDEINNTQKQPNIFNDERIKQLGNKLHNIYAKNIPNQNEILKIIEGYKPTIKDRIKNIFQ
ncbi:MAG: YcaO-like family protein [Candidatus Gastranaerophilales bacterium]|nr:YcaO-like family protein [Candidatus Gastranaerophilales bacterium]